jgi:general secretion pathway protein F
MLIYEGISKTGEKVRGRFIGSKEELFRSLQEEGILLLSIREEKEVRKKKKFTSDMLFNGLEQLYYLLTAGLKIDVAIGLIIRSLSDKSSAELWEDILKKLKEGKQLSVAIREIAQKKKISIPDFYINILSVGEEIGDIAFSLKTILTDVEFKRNLRKEIKNAISYPVFLIIMSILTIIIVATFILPKFSQVFSENEIEKLPVISRVVLSSGVLIRENLLTILFIFLLISFFMIYVFSLKSVKGLLKTMSFRIPYLGKMLLKLELSNIFSSLSAMLRGGVEINRAIKFSISVTSHPQIKNILEETAVELKKGRRISETWGRYSFIPPDVIALVSVGENSANLDEILARLGKKYMEDFKSEISRLLTFLEPAIIVIVGLFIAFIVIAILLAVLSISDVF